MRVLLLVLVGAITFSGFASAETFPTDSAHRPLILQYVSPFRDGDTKFSSISVVSPEQMTTDEGVNPLFDGISLIIPWTMLEPKEGQFDFSVIDQALDYWGKRGKVINLNVAPITFPTVVGKAWGGKLMGGTPDWVMQQCETHVVQCRLLYPTEDKVGPFAIPTPWDPHFEKDYFDLVAHLGAKYDGDPRLVEVRIGTGTQGEENPIFNKGRANVYTGFTYAKWYAYCRDTVAAYVQAFKKSTLECDLTFAGEADLDVAGGGHDEVQKLLDLMIKDQVTLGFNAWRGTPVDVKFNDMEALLEHDRDSGHPVTLEVGGALQNPHMWNTAVLLATVQRLRPLRINFMGNTAAIVNYAEGIQDPRDAVALELYKKTVIGKGGDPLALAKKFHALIIALREVDTTAPAPASK